MEIGEEPVDIFELDASSQPMLQTLFCKEQVVAEIVRQIGNWNMYMKQDGAVTASQGGFNFNCMQTIQAPDVAFMPNDICCMLSEEQHWNFQGSPSPQALLLR